MKRMIKAFSCILAAAVITSTVSSSVKAAEATVSTDETVYVNLDYYGKTRNVNIVKGVQLNGNTSFMDYGSYDQVTNMSTEDKPVISDGSVSWKLSGENNRFYYECKPKEGTVKMPWTFDISYKLNGVPVNADKLAGASGMIEINIKAEPDDNTSDYIKNNMVLTVSSTFDMEDTLSVEAPGAEVQSAGNYKAVMFTCLPGEENNFTMRIGTNSFETSGIIMAVIPGTLDQIKEIKELKEEKDTIEDSADAIYDSLNEILKTYQSTSDGLSELQSGLAALDKARGTINSSKDGLYADADVTLKDITTISDEINALVPHLKNGQELVKEINTNTNAMTDTMNRAKPCLESYLNSVGIIQDNVNQMSDLLNELDTKSQFRDNLLNNITDNITTAEKDLDSLAGTTHDMSGDFDSLGDDLRELNSLISNLDKLKSVQSLPMLLYSMYGITPDKETLAALSKLSDSLSDVSDSLDEVLRSSEWLFDDLNGLCNDGKTFLNTANDAVDLAESYNISLDNGRKISENLLKEMGNVNNTSKDILRTGTDLIDQISSFNDTMNQYESGTVNTIKDTETLFSGLTVGLTDLHTFLKSLEKTMRAGGKNLNDGTGKSISGSEELLQKSLSSISSVKIMKNANDTIKKTYEQEMDDLENDSNLLNMDPNAVPVSFTSTKNITPSSIQIIMRTDEISIEDKAENNTDLEKAEDNPGILSRLEKIFVVIKNKLTSIFS